MADYTKDDRGRKWWKDADCGDRVVRGTVRASATSTEAASAASAAATEALELAQHFLDKIAAEGCPARCNVLIIRKTERRLLGIDVEMDANGLWQAVARASLDFQARCEATGTATAIPPSGHFPADLHCGLNKYAGQVSVAMPNAAATEVQRVAEELAENVLKRFDLLTCPDPDCPRRHVNRREKRLTAVQGGDKSVRAYVHWIYQVSCSKPAPSPAGGVTPPHVGGTETGSGAGVETGPSTAPPPPAAGEVACPDPQWEMPAGTPLAFFTYTGAHTGDAGTEQAQAWEQGAGLVQKNATLAKWKAEIQKRCGRCKAGFQPDPPPTKLVYDDYGHKVIWKIVLAEDLKGVCTPP